MTEPSLPEESIFAQALDIASAAERAAFLDRACGNNPALRAELEALLRAHARSGDVLDLPEYVALTTDLPGREGPGTVIGPYKLLEQIGEGGMGAVWMAEQTQPIQRRVAIKVVKEGMDSQQVLTRFEAERQALALMEHPNIAKVLDAGCTPLGRPYFVMELVKGQPITKYCDDKRLAVRERLDLFGDVCRAVQHAHQKGIIHRDIKPSNVLVAPYDGKPVVKVIDFGVAKATGQRLTDKTLFTGFGALVGTPEYMSPEQAEVNNQDIDTRSDIYSLGVLLYELLTGSTPLTRKRIKEVALLEALRVIREEEPPRPSTRLSESKDSLPSLSARRQTEPAKLTKLVRGELDWIVMKALEKDRNRRYQTANGFAMDVQRYLADEPVAAGPPSAWYRFGKFARRHKGQLAVAGLILFFLMLLGAGGGWVAFDRATRRAKASHDLELALDRANLFLGQGKRAEARAGLDQAKRITSEAQPSLVLQERLAELRNLLAAAEQDQQFLAGYEDIRLRWAARVDVVNSRFTRDDVLPEIRELFRQYEITFVDTALDEAAARIQNRPEPIRHQLVAALYDCGRHTPNDDTRTLQWLRALLEVADTDSWRVNIRKAIAARDWQAVEQLVRAVGIAKQPPGLLVQFAEILPAELKAVRLDFLRRIQRAYPADLWANHELAWELVAIGRHGEASRYFTAALALRPDSAGLYLNRGNALGSVGEVDAAIMDYRQCLALAPRYAAAHVSLCSALVDKRLWREALAECEEAIQIDPKLAPAWSARGVVHVEFHQYDRGLADYSEAIKLDPKLASAWYNRGHLHVLLHQYEKGLADFVEAIKLDPKPAALWSERGNAYLLLRRYDKAIADCSEAIRLDPKQVQAWYCRGGAYAALRQYEKALADCTKAIEVDPRNARAHYNLGYVLAELDRRNDAIAEYQEALRLDKGYPEAHSNLGIELVKNGQFAEALVHLRQAQELASKIPGWPYPTARMVRQCARLVELDRKLPGFLDCKITPASPDERIELAQLCSLKRLNRAAVRLYAEAFAAQPKLADDLGPQHRYNAACAAALAGCGQGKDADKLDDKEKARLRGQALGWLRADLEAQRLLLDKDATKAGAYVIGLMRHWLADADFAGLRGPEALAKLPEAERQPWQKLWKDIFDMLMRAQKGTTPEKTSGAK